LQFNVLYDTNIGLFRDIFPAII